MTADQTASAVAEDETPSGAKPHLQNPGPVVWQWIFLGAALVGLLAGLLGGIVLSRLQGWPESTDAKLAAYGSWAASIGAILLALVSVWQTRQANEQARSAEERAQAEVLRTDQRHRNDLLAAELRLRHELDAQRRREQLSTIPPIWDAISDIAGPTQELHNSISDARGLLPGELRKLKDKYEHWEPLTIRATSTFTAGFLLIDDTEVRNMLITMENFLRHLSFETNALYIKARNKEHFTDHEIDEVRVLREQLLSLRPWSIDLARERLGS